MTRKIIILLVAFSIGALIALVVRASLFDPHSVGGADEASMTNTLTPQASMATDPHKGHAHATETPSTPVAPAKPAPSNPAPSKPEVVNTVCAICGMEVDPKVPTATYQGKTIGFGCKMCPAKFAKDPDRWGPSALKNEVHEE